MQTIKEKSPFIKYYLSWSFHLTDRYEKVPGHNMLFYFFYCLQ